MKGKEIAECHVYEPVAGQMDVSTWGLQVQCRYNSFQHSFVSIWYVNNAEQEYYFLC